MDQNPAEAKQVLQADVPAVDVWLKNAWDRAKKAAELISRLREEKAELQAKVSSMEEELLHLKQEVARLDETIKSAPSAQGNHAFLSNGEKAELGAKVRELLAKLEGYV